MTIQDFLAGIRPAEVQRRNNVWGKLVNIHNQLGMIEHDSQEWSLLIDQLSGIFSVIRHSGICFFLHWELKLQLKKLLQ